MVQENSIQEAAKAIKKADALFIGAGAGMSVDSGLPDFRGTEGFWRAYPLFKEKELLFEDLASADLFFDNPELAWWFYGQRFKLYQWATPHRGYEILKRLMASKSLPGFVYTSNVDGHFHEAGFSKEHIFECHGNIHYLQCASGCRDVVWPLEKLGFVINDNTLAISGDLPKCHFCGGIARPNILMFYDEWWRTQRALSQQQNLHKWQLQVAGRNVLAIELGAGSAIPSVRLACQNNAHQLVRINPVHFQTSKANISVPFGGLQTLAQLEAELNL